MYCLIQVLKINKLVILASLNTLENYDLFLFM